MNATLSSKQATSIAQATARINLWDGAVRSGKTIASSIAWLDFIARAGPGPLLMAGKTKDTLERNVIDPISDLFGQLGPSAVVHTRGANTAVILGRLVHIVGAHDAKAEGRIRGLTLRGAYVDEASLVPEAWWRMLLTRLSLPDAKLFATTNPDAPRHWLRREFILKQAKLDLARWHFTLDDNPALDPSFVSALKSEHVGLFYQRFIEGRWVAAEGAIYGMLDPDTGGRHIHHLDLDPAKIAGWWVAVDYGTTNPFVALLICEWHDQDASGLHVASEWRWDPKEHGGVQKTDGQYADDMRAWLDRQATKLKDPRISDPERVIVDPSAASFRVQLHNDGWAGVTAADNAVVDGIRETSSLLAHDPPLLTWDPSCEGLTGEMAGYVWDPKAQERGEDAPVKLDDHGPDALRYGVRTLRPRWMAWLRSQQQLSAAA